MSNPNKKPVPLFVTQTRPTCPICGHASYSTSGIHPQCAMQAEDRIRTDRIKARLAIPTPEVASSESLRRYEKRCPKCQTVHPARRYKCGCGHMFFQLKVT